MKKFLILILLLVALPVYAQSTERISPTGDSAKPGNERSTEMQTANPDYQYYGILNHDWKTKDGEFSVTVLDGSFTLRTPYGGELQSRFAVALPSDASSGMRGPVMVALPDRLVVHDGEEFALLPRDRAVCNPDGNEVFRLVKFWYGAGTLHADLVWLVQNRRLELDFVQGKVEEEKLPEGVDAWKCKSCGMINRGGRFCPECGERRP